MFGYSDNVKSKVRVCTPQLFNKAIDSPKTGRICAEIADALEQVKRGEMSRDDFETFKGEHKKLLPIFTPHATYTDGRRLNEQAVPSGLSMYDVDHLPNPRGYYQQAVAGREAELGIVLAHVTPSTEGLRFFFVIPAGCSLEEAQLWMSRQLSDAEYDNKVKDFARSSFVVPRDYILYLNEDELFRERDAQVPINAPVPTTTAENAGKEEPVCAEDLCFKGIPYADIISEWWTRRGGIPAIGERNVKLHQLAMNLKAICDNRKEVLMQVMPRLGLSEQELRSIVDSACKEGPRGISKQIQEVISALSSTDNALQATPAATPIKIERSKLPLGLRESLAGVPQNMYWPVLCAVLPMAGAYADQVEVEYCDGNRQRLGLMSIILGDQASGKSVCKYTVDVWKRQLEEEDALARKREEEWRERKKGRKANEKAPEDPKVLIRVLPITVSCSTLLRRFKNAPRHTEYSFGEELDTLRKTNGAGSWSSKYDIYRLSFDQGEWGQDYNSDQAESGVVKVAYNWTVLGTYGAMRKCFKAENIENGLSSRVLVAEMPDGSFAKMPRYGRRTEEDEARIDEAVNRLRTASGFYDTPRLRRAIERWVEQKRIEAAKDIDRVKDTYRKRSAVIGFRAGVIYYLLEGTGKESNRCLDFALKVAEYCLAEQIKIFGEALQNQYLEASEECQRIGVNVSIFDQLPPTFGREDLMALKRGQCSSQSIKVIISRWKSDGWIEKIGHNQWSKKVTK